MAICSVRTNKFALPTPSAAPSIARILHQIPMVALLANIVFFVVAVAFGGVEGDGGGAAGTLVALVVVGNGRDGFGQGFCHASSPYFTEGERGAWWRCSAV